MMVFMMGSQEGTRGRWKGSKGSGQGADNDKKCGVVLLSSCVNMDELNKFLKILKFLNKYIFL